MKHHALFSSKAKTKTSKASSAAILRINVGDIQRSFFYQLAKIYITKHAGGAVRIHKHGITAPNITTIRLRRNSEIVSTTPPHTGKGKNAKSHSWPLQMSTPMGVG